MLKKFLLLTSLSVMIFSVSNAGCEENTVVPEEQPLLAVNDKDCGCGCENCGEDSNESNESDLADCGCGYSNCGCDEERNCILSGCGCGKKEQSEEEASLAHCPSEKPEEAINA